MKKIKLGLLPKIIVAIILGISLGISLTRHARARVRYVQRAVQ